MSLRWIDCVAWPALGVLTGIEFYHTWRAALAGLVLGAWYWRPAHSSAAKLKIFGTPIDALPCMWSAAGHESILVPILHRAEAWNLKHWTEESGLILSSKRARLLLDHAIKLVEAVRDREVAARVLAEAVFRVLDLPRRDIAYRKRYMEINK